MRAPLQPQVTRAEFAGQSGAGQVRVVNQDTFFVGLTPQGVLAVVADGMGGHQSGELASQKATEVLTQMLGKPQKHLPAALARAVQSANLAVYEYALAHPESRGMGTTLTALVIDDQVGLVAHVGDSRAYLIRDGSISQLTRDHSWVADRLRQGLLSEAEAQRHRWRNILTNALGTAPEVRLELSHLHLQAGDRLLLCSDGLTMLLPDALLLHSMQLSTPDGAVRDLTDKANARGSPDNLTAVAVFVEAVTERPKRYALPQQEGLQENAAYTTVQLGEGASGVREIEVHYPLKGRFAKLRRHPLYPYRFWLLGCLYLFGLFIFFSVR